MSADAENERCQTPDPVRCYQFSKTPPPPTVHLQYTYRAFVTVRKSFIKSFIKNVFRNELLLRKFINSELTVRDRNKKYDNVVLEKEKEIEKYDSRAQIEENVY